MTLRVLGIDVPDHLLDRWAAWLAPPVQPFLSEGVAHTDRPALSLELVDTYELYGLPAHVGIRWIDEEAFQPLPRPERVALVRDQVRLGRAAVPTVRGWGALAGPAAREQADGHRFVWWPSLLQRHRKEVLARFVTNDRLPSRHQKVPLSVWRAAERKLPGAHGLAGTFPGGSGPNCFLTVMAAAGRSHRPEDWLRREPFESWLAQSCRPGGTDGAPGTVLVWRTGDGHCQHAAVTLGEGWALHKPSQGWMSPTKVLRVDEVLRRARVPGHRLERHQVHVPG